MNRGGQVVSEIVEPCRSHEITDLSLVRENRGQPDGLIVCHLQFGPTAYFGLLNAVTRHDIKDRKAMGKMSEAYPHLILDNFTTKHQVYQKHGGPKSIDLKEVGPVLSCDITRSNEEPWTKVKHTTSLCYGHSLIPLRSRRLNWIDWPALQHSNFEFCFTILPYCICYISA